MTKMTRSGRLTKSDTAAPPQEGYGRLFLRFLRFGLLAWGAQSHKLP